MIANNISSSNNESWDGENDSKVCINFVTDLFNGWIKIGSEEE